MSVNSTSGGSTPIASTITLSSPTGSSGDLAEDLNADFPEDTPPGSPDPDRKAEWVATTVPMGAPNDLDGHCVWITNSETKDYYFSNSDFPSAISSKRLGKPKFVVKETQDGMGLGVFATKDIERFEIILIERPYLIYPRNFPHLLDKAVGVSAGDVEGDKAKSETDAKEGSQITPSENMLRNVVNYTMKDKDKLGFMDLANPHTKDGHLPLNGIIQANTYGITFRDPETDSDFENGYAAVMRTGSRFNHSCIPDVDHVFDPVTFSMRFSAVRDIKAGSQIYTSYVPVYLTKAERQAQLAPYGFQCTCRSCVNATVQSDRLRRVHRAMIENWSKQVDNVWLKDPDLSLRILDPLLATKTKMEEEGLDVVATNYFVLYEILHKVYSKLGLWRQVRQCTDALLDIGENNYR